jgi:hypothetical protein
VTKRAQREFKVPRAVGRSTRRGVEKYLADDISVHAPPRMELDRDAWLATEKAFFPAFDDIDVKVLHQVAEGDKLVSRWSMTARQTADFKGVPSLGGTAMVTGTFVDVIRDDKVAPVGDEPAAVQVLPAFFLPGVVYISAAIGTQMQTVVIRGFSVGVTMRATLRRELASGFLLSLVIPAAFVPWR